MSPASPQPAAKYLSELPEAVLANSRITLPVAAAADIRSGTVAPTVLKTLQSLAGSHTMNISVVESGHPKYVFGTTRLSDHPKGFAVDIWAIDGKSVVDPSNRALVVAVMRRGIALGAYQAGGPVALAPTSVYFSDETHHDHIHLGFAA